MSKRTLDNCVLIKQTDMKPRQFDGKCEGFQKSYDDDEPCEVCKKCRLNIIYERKELQKWEE